MGRAGEGLERGWKVSASSPTPTPALRNCRTRGRYDAANKLKMYLRKFIAYFRQERSAFLKDFDALLIRNYHTWLKNQELGRNTHFLVHPKLETGLPPCRRKSGLADECHPFEGMDVSYRAKKERKPA